jgi:bifunctional UDP-N-acetylglucosamine pyrophosphorylase/glucosamine-1-phosphate N-acetyltransferase
MTRTGSANACQTRHAIILAAGESKRTRPLTFSRPKPLIWLLDRPLLAHILDQLVGIIEHVTLVVGYRADMIHAYFGDQYRDIQIHYVHQQQINGTAGALLTVAEQTNDDAPSLDEPFFLLYGDNLISRADLLSVCEQRYSMAALPVDDPSAFGVLDIANGYVQRIIEKPTAAAAGSLANPGIYHFDGNIFEALHAIQPSPRGEYELTDLIGLLAAQHHVAYSVCKGHWIPVGTPWDVLTATIFLLRQRTNLRPNIDPEAMIHPSTQIDGYVHIGRASIGPNCRIVGPAYISDNVTLSRGCVIEQSVLNYGTTLGEHCTVEQSIVGSYTSIGLSSIIEYSVLDQQVTLGTGTRLPRARFDSIRPVAATNGLVDHAHMRRRGVVIGQNVTVAARMQIEPGSIVFPNDASSRSIERT